MKTRIVERRFKDLESACKYAAHVNKVLHRKGRNAATVERMEWLQPTGHGFETHSCYFVAFRTRSEKF